MCILFHPLYADVFCDMSTSQCIFLDSSNQGVNVKGFYLLRSITAQLEPICFHPTICTY